MFYLGIMVLFFNKIIKVDYLFTIVFIFIVRLMIDKK